MAESFAFANRGTITVTGLGTGFTSSTTLGVVKDVEVTWSAEHVPLYGWGATTRQAVARHSEKVTVKIGWCKFDPTKTSWFPMAIMKTGAVPDGTSTATNAVRLFTVVALFTMEDGTLMRGTVNNVFFPDFPIKAAEGQWVKVELSGEGTDVTFANV